MNPLTADHVYPAPGSVVKEAVRVGTNLRRRHYLPVSNVKDQQAGRHAASDKQPLVRFIERHTSAGCGRLCRPASESRTLYHICDPNLFFVRNINEHARSIFLKLEWLGPRVHNDLRALLLSIGVEKRKRPASRQA
jgi:hypothetical protein